MALQSNVKMILAGLGVSGLSGIAYLYYKARNQKPPTKWKPVGILKDIYYFPIKSCAGIKLELAVCDNLGIHEEHIRDRALMLVDESGQMVSARTYPKMFQIQPEVLPSGKLLIKAPEMEPIQFDYFTIGLEGKKDITADLWGSQIFVMDCGEEYHKWFSKFILGKEEGLRLVYYPYPIPTKKVIDKNFQNGIFLNEDTGTFQDVSSYMLMSENSVNDLNTRLDNNLDPLQFRGNFIIKTNGSPYEEDNWQWIRIGDETVFRNLAPCYRCILPNINPFSAERDPNFEPLRTLKTYRVWGQSKSPRMGLQLGLRVGGKTIQGDIVYAEDNS